MDRMLAVTIFAYIFTSVGIFSVLLACFWREERQRRAARGAIRGADAFVEDDIENSVTAACTQSVIFSEVDLLEHEESVELEFVEQPFQAADLSAG